MLWFDCRDYNFGRRGADRLAHDIAPQLVSALENAPAEPEWEWGYAGETLVGVHSATSQEAAREDVANLRRYWKRERNFWVVRRRKASDWEPADPDEANNQTTAASAVSRAEVLNTDQKGTRRWLQCEY
ncbi:hypothetical protein [Leucobacter sp. 1207-22]|uniref:hypothetical protein n=1 Tax=Leucobacter sp. 1207-22 TaxID=2604456 RepID=UPI0040631C4A